MITVRVTGGAAVVAQFFAFRGRVVEGVKSRVHKYTELIAGGARERAPVDWGVLRQALITVYSADDLTGEAGVSRQSPASDYAPYVEFGTGLYAVHGDGRKTPWVYFDERRKIFVTTTGNPPQPYLLPAFAEWAPRFAESIRDLVRSETARTARQRAFGGRLGAGL